MNIVALNPKIQFPNLYSFETIKCTQKEWEDSKWFFRIVSTSSDIEKDSGYSECTIMQALVDMSKTYKDESLGDVYRVLLCLGDGVHQSFGKDNQYSILPKEHLLGFWLPLDEEKDSILFNQVSFMTKEDLLTTEKIDIIKDI